MDIYELQDKIFEKIKKEAKRDYPNECQERIQKVLLKSELSRILYIFEENHNDIFWSFEDELLGVCHE